MSRVVRHQKATHSQPGVKDGATQSSELRSAQPGCVQATRGFQICDAHGGHNQGHLHPGALLGLVEGLR